MAKGNKENNTQLILGILSFLGVIITGILAIVAPVIQDNLRQRNEPTAFPTWTTVPTATIPFTAVPTDTVAAGEPTSTAAPNTATPEPSSTPEPPAIGEDWVNGCISALWQAVPADIQTQQVNGCLQQPVGDFSISDGRFTFLVNQKFGSAEVHGMFAPLTAEGTVSLKVHPDVLERGEIWMGVFASPSIDSSGAIMVIPAGDPKKRPLVLKTMPGQSKLAQSQQFTPGGAVYDVTFNYTIGTVAVSAMNDAVAFNPVPVVSNQKWLFVGFQASNGTNSIGASFYDLAFQQ